MFKNVGNRTKGRERLILTVISVAGEKKGRVEDDLEQHTMKSAFSFYKCLAPCTGKALWK